MNSLTSKLTLLKSNCVICDAHVIGSISLCDACKNDLPRVEFACESCALPLENRAVGKLCGQCLNQENHVDYALSLFHFVNPIDYLIRQMKFKQQLSAAAVLADLLKNTIAMQIENNQLEQGLPDAILPMPLHKKRLTKRGFNQSLEIVKPVAKSQNIPIILDIISRTKETQTQTNLNKQQRKKNVSACFTLLKKPMYSHIVIVDDVVTTGATTNELAKQLKKFGVEKVGVWSLARAELN